MFATVTVGTLILTGNGRRIDRLSVCAMTVQTGAATDGSEHATARLTGIEGR